MHLVLIDFDGPTKKVYGDRLNRTGGALAPNVKDWTFGINHTGLRFGHGFVLAALLVGVGPSQYSQLTEAEEAEYRHSVGQAIAAGRVWAHPPFVRAVASSPEFKQWLEETVPK